MEDIKNEEKKECCGDKKDCCNGEKGFFSACKHCHCGHKLVKLILAIIIVCALLRIGMAFGERRVERLNYGRFEGRTMMKNSGDRGNFRDGRERGADCQALVQENDVQATRPILEKTQNQEQKQIQKVAPSAPSTSTPLK